MKSINPQDVCDLLNEMLKLDYDCVEGLIKYRQECNKQIAYHPTIMTRQNDNKFTVGIIGVLNGLFEPNEDGFGCICYELDDEDIIVRFKLT